ncbi:MAG: hypothetical protein V9H69_26005 [Anaerolineae bacterium]
MRSFTSVDLACSWSEASRYLSKRWLTALAPYVNQERSSIMGANLQFTGADPCLAEFLAVAEQKTVSDPSDRSFLNQIGLKRVGGGSLLRRVSHWNEYDFSDLEEYPVVQLLLDRTVELTRPLSQYYRVEIEPNPDCTFCGRALLIQQNPLRVRGKSQPTKDFRGEAWQPGDDIAASENYEIILSQRLRHLWERSLPDPPQFSPVENNGDEEPLWQVAPQGMARVLAPPTPLQVRERCPGCGQPLTTALSTSLSEQMFGPDRATIYEDEARLTIDPASWPAGDFWVTDRQIGRVGELMEVLQGYQDDPIPFYIRSSRPFWLISRWLLRLLHEHVPSGWHAIPVDGPS